MLEIGKRVRRARKEVSLSIEDMADRMNLSYEAYRRIETGKVLVTTDNLILIATILGITTDYILKGTKEEICDEEIARIINLLSDDERVRAKKVLMAVFPTLEVGIK